MKQEVRRGVCRFSLTVLCILLGMLLSPTPATAQPTRAWLGVGVAGGATSEDDGGLGVSVRIAGQRAPHQVEVRSILMSDFSSFPDGSGDSVGDIGLLYGRIATNAFGSVAIAGGPSLAWTDDCPAPSTDCYSFGLAMSADLAVQSRVIGIGLQGFGNLNNRKSFVGLAVVLYLGWIP